MINQTIDHFSFWTPVVFTLPKPLGKSYLSDLAWRLGSWADQYASLGQKTLHVEAERIGQSKIYFESKEFKDVSLWVTARKATSYFLTLFILPAIALVAKAIFKIYLNTCLTTTKKSPNELLAEKLIGKTKIVLLSGSLLEETAEAIVNPANGSLKHLGGVCGIIGKASGRDPFDECEDLLKNQNRKNLACGEAVLTSAGDLAPRIKVIVHAVGPDFSIKDEKEHGPELLAAAHTNSLKLITEPEMHPDSVSSKVESQPKRSIAFPAISTGIFGYPKDEAATVAFKATIDFIKENPDAIDEVRFVFLPLEKDKDKTSTYYVKAFEALNDI